ncbi:uncharacterized protein LOC114952422 [Acropora millepora]|uniref:uncharacterized protein LOC114952422 n=1 Tax=Acropora millepora TaxID=45264 RepID=UPI001CF361B2|nr:uncharacterized protein LOC114952422 [Acropora millepora]
MNQGYYGVIVIAPSLLLSTIILFIGFILWWKIPNFARLVATYTFPNIIQKKKNANGTISWEVRGVEIEDGTELLSKITRGVCLSLVILIYLVSVTFFQLLLLEVSYDCDPNEKSKDCFGFKNWDSGWDSNAPINCTSQAVIDRSVEIAVCYEIVFNFGIAAGASYGVFKISNGVLELVANLILMRKTTTCLCLVRVLVVLVHVGGFAVLVAVQVTSLRVYLDTTNLRHVTQGIATLMMASLFTFLVPWKDLIKKNNEERSTREQEHGLDNITTMNQ